MEYRKDNIVIIAGGGTPDLRRIVRDIIRERCREKRYVRTGEWLEDAFRIPVTRGEAR